MNTYVVIIAFCLIVVASYFYGVIGRRLRIPSVILLIATGIGLRQIAESYALPISPLDFHVKVLGTVGLIMIVLEAALDLVIRRKELALIRRALGSALVTLVVSTLLITMLIAAWLDQPYLTSLLYAIPLSIVSSAVVIPSTVHLEAYKREFVIYESSLSDILGILLFNYFALGNSLSAFSLAVYGGNLALSLLISAVASVALVLLLVRLRGHARFFLLFAVLIALYAMGKLFHVPSLVLILLFGIVVANWERLERIVRLRWLTVPPPVLHGVRKQLVAMTAETAFVVRTFFFVLFGFSMDITSIMHLEVVAVGSAIVAVLVGVRFVYLRYVMRLERTMPELVLMPRGLITVLLFYSIPPEFRMSGFSDGVVFFVIVASALLMMVGLMVYRRTEEEDSVDDTHFLDGTSLLATEETHPDGEAAAPKG